MQARVPSPLASLPPAFKALSDPTRLRILNLLAEREVCVCFLGDVLRIVQPTISRHLAYLKKSGLVTARRDAQWTHYLWAQHPNPLVRGTMDGLREWMLKDPALTAERRKLKAVCCR